MALAATLGTSRISKKCALNRLPATGPWSEHFQSGKHYHIAAGQELSDLKELFEQTTDTVVCPIGKNARSVMLLTESGVYRVCAYAKTETANKFRDWFFDDMLPTLRRQGWYSLPGAEPPPVEAAVVATPDDPATMRAKARLADATRRTAEGKARALRRLLEFLGDDVDPKTRKVYEVKAAEIEVGQDLTRLLPVETEVWKSPSDIAADHDVTPNRVGRIISQLELRGDDRYCRTIANKSRSSVREVPSYLYNADGVKRIATGIAEWKAIASGSGGGKACGAGE